MFYILLQKTLKSITKNFPYNIQKTWWSDFTVENLWVISSNITCYLQKGPEYLQENNIHIIFLTISYWLHVFQVVMVTEFHMNTYHKHLCESFFVTRFCYFCSLLFCLPLITSTKLHFISIFSPCRELPLFHNLQIIVWSQFIN